MDRRQFFRRSALIAAGVVAADQLELLEKLTWKRTLFPGWSPKSPDVWGHQMRMVITAIDMNQSTMHVEMTSHPTAGWKRVSERKPARHGERITVAGYTFELAGTPPSILGLRVGDVVQVSETTFTTPFRPHVR